MRRALLVVLMLACVSTSHGSPGSASAERDDGSDRYAQEISRCQEALARNPNDLYMLHKLARLLSLDKRYSESISAYKRILELAPGDADARAGLARVASWMGQYDDAIELYKSVVADYPRHVEARLGLGDVLSWKGEHAAAIEHFLIALAMVPDDVEILKRLGKVWSWRRNRAEALKYYEMAAQLAHDDGSIARAIEQISYDTRHKVEVEYLFEKLNFARDAKGMRIGWNYLGPGRLATGAAVRYLNKFDRDNITLAWTLGFRPAAGTALDFEIALSPKGEVVAEQTYGMGLTRRISSRFDLIGAYRFLKFEEANIQIVSPGLTWYITDRANLSLLYYLSRTSFEGNSARPINHSALVKLAYSLSERASAYTYFATGSESFETITIDRIGKLSANSYGFGIQHRITPRFGIKFGYEFQDRSGPNSQHSLILSPAISW